MDAMQFWDAVGRDAVKRMCQEIGTTYNYWKHIANRRKRPSVDMARKMVAYAHVHHPDHPLSLDELLVPREELHYPVSAPAPALGEAIHS